MTAQTYLGEALADQLDRNALQQIHDHASHAADILSRQLLNGDESERRAFRDDVLAFYALASATSAVLAMIPPALPSSATFDDIQDARDFLYSHGLECDHTGWHGANKKRGILRYSAGEEGWFARVYTSEV